jgi:hypothetical protein
MSSDPTTIADQLKMDHLSTADLKKETVKATKPEAEEDPRDQEVYPFHFDWTDVRGKRWQGDFVNKILSMGELQSKAALKSRLTGGAPVDSIDPYMRTLNEAVSHMTFSLDKSPDWAKDLQAIKDPTLIFKVWDKVQDHEERFFRLTPAAGDSEK